MIDEALALQDAGADVALVECIPAELAARLTEALANPADWDWRGRGL
jgi:3-methyl-2-oxobutanoate hydroxymethyltransferase